MTAATAAPAARKFVSSLADGDNLDETYLVAEKQLRANRNGNLFLQLELRDRTGGISARLWNAGEPLSRTFEAGDFANVKGKVQLFQGSLQVILTQITRVGEDKVELGDFLPHTEKDVSKLWERLRQVLRTMTNPHLRTLAECFFMDADFAAAFCKAPAGVRNHHAYIGGLLEHVVTMLEGADRLAPLYPDLDRDVFLMGVFLHDVGKLRELTYDRMFGYSDEGQLVGHLVIGVEMLNAKIAEARKLTGAAFPDELRLRLQHVVVGHHGTLEFGSPRVPMTPECIAIHYLDNLDAKLHAFTRDIKEDTSGSAWTAFNQGNGRRLFKGRKAAAESVEDEED